MMVLVRPTDLAGPSALKRFGRADRHMPGSGEPRTKRHAPIIGREAGLARMRELMDQVPPVGQVLLVTGEAEAELARLAGPDDAQHAGWTEIGRKTS
jgi:hypothetical protein